MDDSAITCDEIIESYDEDEDAEVKSNDEAKSNEEANSYNKTKAILTNFNEKKQPVKLKKSIFYCHFY